MLRVILRTTHNSLLFACILLLLCSFERLRRYDFGQVQVGSPNPNPNANPNILEDDLQVDHFVFWGGIPAWERSQEATNPVRVGLFKFMAWANRFGGNHPRGVVPPAMDPTRNDDVMTATTLTEANVLLKRQIRHNKKNHGNGSHRTKKEDIRVALLDSATTSSLENAAVATTASDVPQPPTRTNPKIGFVLYLPSCDRDAIANWQKVWHDQALDQPFLFYVLLGHAVEESCAPTLQAELLQNGIGHDHDSTMIYQVARNDRLGMALQTCQNPRDALLEGLDEFLYYDVSKASGRIRSSASMRRFQQPLQGGVPSSPSFRCTGRQQKPAFCDDRVRDCPWFQYSPAGGSDEPETEFPATTA